MISKPVRTAPQITESHVNDEGKIMHRLANGNTQSDESYMAMWGKPKGIILPKHTKGDNPNGLWVK